jgi:hypothetical protein
MHYFGVIEHATRERASTADIWSAIRAQAAAEGLESPGVTAQDVSRLRGAAGRIRAASAALSRAEPGYGIDAPMIALAPWSRSLAERNTLPMYQVRFLHTTNVAGQEQSDWRSIMLRGATPPTVGDLMSQLQRDAEQMAEGYNSAHVSMSNIDVLAV